VKVRTVGRERRRGSLSDRNPDCRKLVRCSFRFTRVTGT
jgi:hypothetical protein